MPDDNDDRDDATAVEPTMMIEAVDLIAEVVVVVDVVVVVVAAMDWLGFGLAWLGFGFSFFSFCFAFGCSVTLYIIPLSLSLSLYAREKRNE